MAAPIGLFGIERTVAQEPIVGAADVVDMDIVVVDAVVGVDKTGQETDFSN